MPPTIWNSLGFTQDPCSKLPLKGDAIGAKLFVARRSELGLAKSYLAQGSTGFFVVDGDLGVGKTSFVNHVLYSMYWDKDGPFHVNVNVTDDIGNVQELLKTVLISLANKIRESLEQDRSWWEWTFSHIKSTIGQDELRSLLDWCSPRGAATATAFGGQLEVARDGTNIEGASRATLQLQMTKLADKFRQLPERQGILVVLDNCENLGENLIPVLRDCRDTLFGIDGIWWIVLGGPRIASRLRRELPQLTERMSGSPLTLPGLTFQETREAVRLRMAEFSSDPSRPIELITDKTYYLLYTASEGRIRFVLDIIGEMMQRFVNEIILTVEDTVGILNPSRMSKLVRDRITDNLSHRRLPEEIETRLLKEVVRGRLDAELSVHEIELLMSVVSSGSVGNGIGGDDVQTACLEGRGLLRRIGSADVAAFRLSGLAYLASELGMFR